MLLLVAVMWLWVRSHQGPDYVEYGGNGRWLLKVISGHGTMDFLVIPRWPQEEKFRVGRYPDDVYYGTRYSKRILGFGTAEQWPEYGGRYVNVPHWVFVLAFAGMGFWFGRKWWKRREKGSGRCGVCGYDMRATPQRCPECGTVTWKPELRNSKSESMPNEENPHPSPLPAYRERG
jgi:hypothetical protein